MMVEKDKKRLLMEAYFLDDDIMFNATHPATVERDRLCTRRNTRTHTHARTHTHIQSAPPTLRQ